MLAVRTVKNRYQSSTYVSGRRFQYRCFSAPVSVFQRIGIGVSAWITSAGYLEHIARQGIAPFDASIGVSAWTSRAIHRLTHRVLVTRLRPGQLARVTSVTAARIAGTSQKPPSRVIAVMASARSTSRLVARSCTASKTSSSSNALACSADLPGLFTSIQFDSHNAIEPESASRADSRVFSSRCMCIRGYGFLAGDRSATLISSKVASHQLRRTVVQFTTCT